MRRSLPLLAAALLGGGACESDEKKVAELVEVLSGSVEKQSDEGEGWEGASRGAEFYAGDAVRTSPDGGARLELRKGGGLELGPSTLIRFGRGALDLEEGEVEAEESAELDLVFGSAEIAKGSRIKLVQDQEGNYRFDVLVGSARISREDGDTVSLSEGEGMEFDVEVGDIDIQPPAPPDAGPPPDAPAPDAAPPPSSDVSAVVKGRGGGIKRDPDGKWERLGPGEYELPEGAEIKLRRRARAELSRGEEKATVIGRGRFVIGAPGEPLLEARRGRAELHATEEDVTITVPGGQITARKGKGTGSKAAVGVRRGRANVRARAGRVDVIGKKGARESLQIGESADLARSGGITIEGRAPSFAHFAIPAGRSAFVHDPRAPTNIRFRFDSDCPGPGIVEITRGRAFRNATRIIKGDGSAIARVAPGVHRYRVRCIVDGVLKKKSVARGRLRLNRAAGTKRLPPRPVENYVDADGRTYTVLYQNLLPHITFRWPSAPESGSYKLHVVPARGRTKVVQSDANQVRLRSGQLREGLYDYWFKSGSGRQSKKSKLKIAFDNAADTGYLRSPRVRDSWGSSVKVEGAAIKGWSVSIGNVRLPLDGQYRFDTTYSVPNGKRAIAVRFHHRRRGNHYYVRRNGGR